MKELMRFSLVRRFNNRSTKVFNIILFVVILCLGFADKIMKIVDPSMFESEVVYMINIEEEMIDYFNENASDAYIFKSSDKKVKTLAEQGNMVFTKTEEKYLLFSKYEVEESTVAMFSLYVNTYRKDQLMKDSENIEILLAYNQDISVENKVLEEQIDLSNEKSNLIFMFVTSIYFMMLSFITTVASEVVNEKATKTLELILTSVSAKEHFFAKLLVGWLVIVIQGCLSLSYILFAMLVRSIFDQGSGLIQFVKKLGFLSMEGNTFYALLAEADLSFVFFEKLAVVLLFLLLGVLFIQLVMVIVSSFVSSVEEAGNIQAPFYLVLLGFYYLTLALNNPHDLTEGIGFYLSFVPFLNMLLMPCRLLISDVPTLQIVYSLLFSILSICFIVYKGIPVYERGVLDYSCKGFKQIFFQLRQKGNMKPKKKIQIEEIKNYVEKWKNKI